MDGGGNSMMRAQRPLIAHVCGQLVLYRDVIL